MHAGLTFMLQGCRAAGASRSHAEHLKQRMRKLTRAGSGTAGRDEKLSDEEKSLLDEIERQSRDGRPSTKCCPECGDAMTLVRLDGVNVDCCFRCQGIWFDPGELSFIAGLSSDVPAEYLKGRASRYDCPVCDRAMDEKVLLKPFNLLVDRCRAGHGVYLEEGELRRVFELT